MISNPERIWVNLSGLHLMHMYFAHYVMTLRLSPSFISDSLETKGQSMRKFVRPTFDVRVSCPLHYAFQTQPILLSTSMWPHTTGTFRLWVSHCHSIKKLQTHYVGLCTVTPFASTDMMHSTVWTAANQNRHTTKSNCHYFTSVFCREKQ